MQYIFKETDTFQLLLKENIDNSDYQSIFMLYQPVIGINATSLYLTLIQEKQLTNRINLNFNHTRLMLLLDIDQNELLKAFKQLEFYHLLIRYYYPLKSSYIYELKKPLTTEEFFADETLKTNLINKIGILQFERQKYYFSKYQPEITENFINITNINEETIETNKINNNINLQQLINNLNKAQEDLPKDKIINNYKTNLQLQANLKTQSTTNINNSNTNNIINNSLALMQEKNPEEYLTLLTKKPIDFKLKNTLKSLTFDYQLNNEVINCLLDYVWFKNDNRIEPNYILKIAKTFNENKINNVNDALNHLKLAYQKSKKHSYSNKKTYKQDVLWTNDNYQLEQKWLEEKKSEDDNLMSEKEITEILKEFDKY